MVSCRVRRGTAPGPDGLSVHDINRIPIRALAKLFTCWLLAKRVPEVLLASKTIFIPKKNDVDSPSALRPISMCSILVRWFHKVLASRLSLRYTPSKYQFGFRPVDGVAMATCLLDRALWLTNKRFKSLAVANLDFEKAFDSVNHKALLRILETAGLPIGFIEYLRYIYDTSYTLLCFRGSVSHRVHPTRGVRQGDPLSPLLFNLLMDFLFCHLDLNLGFDIDGERIGYLAYADDVLLICRKSQHLALNFERFVTAAASCGLRVNVDKSSTLVWLGNAKRKRVIFDDTPCLKWLNRTIRPMGVDERFEYLGVQYSTCGFSRKIKTEFQELLLRLSKALLRPQQRLFLLVTNLILKFFHRLVLGNPLIGELNKLDLRVRDFVRTILHLPKDIPISFFHASVKDGGLGIPSFRWAVPIHASIRRGSSAPLARFTVWNGTKLSSINGLNLKFKEDLHQRADGAGLRQASLVPSAHDWVLDGTRFLSGRDYINCIRVRSNSLYTKSRASRGRDVSRLCRRGCNASETLNHVLQVCHATHFFRIARHDAILRLLTREFDNRGFSCFIEPVYRVPAGTFKPDLVAYSSSQVVVVDVQIINDQFNLEEAHFTKVAKYDSVLRDLLEPQRPLGVSFSSLTLNWRGCVSLNSAVELSRLGLSNRFYKLVSSQTLIGGVRSWRLHQRMTARRPAEVRKGIG